MSLFRTFVPTLTRVSRTTNLGAYWTRLFSSLTVKQSDPGCNLVAKSIPQSISQAPYIQVDQQCRTYKHKDILKRRCPGCYFVRKNGILHVECDLKPRHKQIQKMRGQRQYKDDYSKGPWKAAIHWGWKKRAFYKMADPKFVKYDWLDGRIGKEV